MTISRRYEGAPAPVSRKPAVKRVVKKRPAVPRPTRRYEGATLPIAKRPVPMKPSAAAASDVRHAPTVRPGALPILRARGAQAAAGAQRARQGASANDMRRGYVPPRSAWQTQRMFVPTAKLDASQVEDLRHARRPPLSLGDRALAPVVRYARALRGAKRLVEAYRASTGWEAARRTDRKPARRVGKTRAT